MENRPRRLWQLKEQHRRKQEEGERPASKPVQAGEREPKYKKLYNNRRWQRRSKNWRAEYPTCFECALLEQLTPGQHVDHIVPHHGDIDLFSSWDNLQTLCARHHSAKTAFEIKSGFGGPWVQNPNRVVISGLPGAGKTTYAARLGAPRVWDLDVEAAKMGFPKYPRPDAVVTELGHRRDEFLAEPGPCVVIVCNPTWGASLAWSARMTFKHVHVPEAERLNRLRWRDT